MSSNPDEIVQQMQQDFHSLIAYVRAAESQTRTATEVERTLFQRLLVLGLALLRLFFLTRAAAPQDVPRAAATGLQLPAHDHRPITYYSVFGKLSFTRQYFYAAGLGGSCQCSVTMLIWQAQVCPEFYQYLDHRQVARFRCPESQVPSRCARADARPSPDQASRHRRP